MFSSVLWIYLNIYKKQYKYINTHLFFYLSPSWNRFEENYISWFLMKPKARKNRDYLFTVFHKLNLEDAVNYVSEVRA